MHIADLPVGTNVCIECFTCDYTQFGTIFIEGVQPTKRSWIHGVDQPLVHVTEEGYTACNTCDSRVCVLVTPTGQLAHLDHDIPEWLATLRPHHIVGNTWNCSTCLVSSCLSWLYPEAVSVHVGSFLFVGFEDGTCLVDAPTPTILDYMTAFDAVAFCETITKERWDKEGIPILTNVTRDNQLTTLGAMMLAGTSPVDDETVALIPDYDDLETTVRRSILQGLDTIDTMMKTADLVTVLQGYLDLETTVVQDITSQGHVDVLSKINQLIKQRVPPVTPTYNMQQEERLNTLGSEDGN